MRWHILYRLYDAAGELLYVGITRSSVRDRISAHRRKPWGHRIATHTEQRIDGDRAKVLRAEATAICDEQPSCNVYQTDRAPVRGRRSQYGRCGTCRSLRPLTADGVLKQHWSANELCSGSGAIPEPLRNGARSDQEPFRLSRTRADQGAGNRDQGTLQDQTSQLTTAHAFGDWPWT